MHQNNKKNNPSYFSTFISYLIKLFIFLFSIGLGLLFVMIYQVYFGDNSFLKKSTILAKINEETIIYYRDEKTPLGSFFNGHHRRYVPIDEVPTHMVNAIVASEDKYFYDHWGINPFAMMKAFFEGLHSGHFRGGSTITQQTVKNILDRREYSLKRKYREAIAALQLERLYSKRQILEFYLNQFHVVANGNGIGIASRYYFDKDVRDINLVEAAFIAGSVKGPSTYNPFIKYNKHDRDLAILAANARKNYVLKRMYDQGWINEEDFKEAWNELVPFKKGKFRTREVALVSLIKSQVNKKEILDAIGLDDINELSKAGFKIYSTLDADLQEAAQLMMRRNLSRLETILNGFAPEEPENFKPLRDLEVNQYYYGKVSKIVKEKDKAHLNIDFGLPQGQIPYESLIRYAKLLDIAIPIGWHKRLKQLLNQIKIGDVVFVEVRQYDEKAHQAVLELHKKPRVSGGLISIDKGEVLSVVSGFEPEGYNRAIFATRQPGSIFKALTYYAALQLGWTILDQLDNQRRVFPYQGQFYYPRPDHESPYKKVSMIWAGVKSENLASIYLTANLLDKLNLEQFKGVLGLLGLLPEEGESTRDYHYRVARAVGVQLDNEGIKEFQLQNAFKDIAPDLVFSGRNHLLDKIKKMWWGRGYAFELQQLYVLDDEEASDKEKQLRIDLLKNNYYRHSLLADELEKDWQQIVDKIPSLGAEGALSDPELNQILSHFRVLPSRGSRPALGYFRTLPGEEPRNTQDLELVLAPTPGRALNTLDIQAIWGNAGYFTRHADIDIKDVNLEGFLPLGIFRKIQNNVNRRYQAIMSFNSPYDLAKYFQHHDFRIAIGLEYLKKLCKAMGIYNKIEPVLSFPLGTNVVSIAEVAKVYQTFIDGNIYHFYKKGPPNQLNFIKRIEDRFGNILYEPQKVVHQIAKKEYSLEMRQILRKVVTHGTGRRARGELYIKLGLGRKGSKYTIVRIPAYGKTGTTNDYTTASFAGFVPYPVTKRKPLDPSNSYVIASYVGYDFNKEMRRGSFKVTGAQGALPVWTDFAKAAIMDKKYIDFLDTLDLNIIAKKEWPIKHEPGTVNAKVDLARGMILRVAGNSDIETFATTDYGVTGETYFDEFALDASVKSVIRIPRDVSRGLLSPIRIVGLFDEYKEEDKKDNPSQNWQFPTQVEPNAASKLPGEQSTSIPQTFNKDDLYYKPFPSHTTKRPPPKKESARLNKLIKELETEQKLQKIQDKATSPIKKQKSYDPGYVEEELW